ncbi:sensor histidine kinase [Paenibacillus sp. HB172176]|uniref:sensor histidine kinase n=1 Tax=Paenibacillus sp. HB172176 TaxID=2493690 RepID=UPI00143B05DC|nr:sensor histidine kinase [Paenibacillus sp. HB172176]
MLGKLRLFRHFGLKQIAILIFLLLVILPTLGVGIMVQYKYTAILKNQFVDSTTRNLNAVVNQLEEQVSTMEDIADYMNFSPDLNAYLQSDPNEYSDRIDNLHESVEGLLTFHIFSKSYIRSITIDGFNGRKMEMGEPVHGDESRWLSEAAARRGGIVWSEGYTINSDWNGQIKVVSLFRVLNRYKHVNEPLANLVIRLDEESIVRLLENDQFRKDGYVYLLDSQGKRVLESDNAKESGLEPGEMLAQMKEERATNTLYRSGTSSYYAFYHKVEGTDWQVVTAIPDSVIKEQTTGVRMVTTAVLLGILLLVVTALAGFQSMIIGPIVRLKNETTRVIMGDFTARVPIHSKNEISDLNRKFNAMVDTIQELIDHKYKMEIRQRESELKLLQSQMDPHFLYNTLDTIRWTARLEKAERASHLIEMLSRFFRSSLNNGQYETTLLQEMHFVQSYLSLHAVRLGKRLHYSLFMEYTLEKVQVPKTIIQPLVENFLIHGFRAKTSDNWIKVNIFRAGPEIWVDVRDNGIGMTPEQIYRIKADLEDGKRNEESFGALHNIHDRLVIFFGPGYGLELMNGGAGGVWVRLRIPYDVPHDESHDESHDDPHDDPNGGEHNGV